MKKTSIYILLLLTLVNLFNYLDRYILSALAPAIKADLNLSDSQIGFLGTAFMFTYFLISPVFGWLGDKKPRFKLISFGVALWSLATAGSGLAKTFSGLLFSRFGVGVGEASYATISPPLLGDLFPKTIRARVFALFFMAIPVGSALGYLLGGILESRIGWRGAFMAAGIPGVLLAVLLFFLKDPPRGQYDQDDNKENQIFSQKEIYKNLWFNKNYVFTVLGYAAYTFTLGGLAFWMPTYLVRYFDVSLEKGNIVFGGITVLAGFTGTLLGGMIADRWSKRSGDAYLKASILSVVLALPLFIIIFQTKSFFTFSVFLFLLEFLLFFSTSPISAQVVNCVPVYYRATANAACIFVIHLLGDAISPSIMGWISDHINLQTAMFLCPIILLFCALFWTLKVIFFWEPVFWPENALVLPKSQCHRGFHLGGLQENTLEAFQRAAELGVEMIELDVRLSKDNQVVVFHDDTIDRISAAFGDGQKGQVKNLNAVELKKIVNAPTLKELLLNEKVPKFFNIEIKSDTLRDCGLEKAVAEALFEARAESQILISSFNPFSLRRISKHLPYVPRALLVTEENDPKNKFYLKKMLLAFLARAHLVHLDYKMYTMECAAALRSRGIKAAVWTVNDPKKAKDFIAMGAVSVISDNPEILRA